MLFLANVPTALPPKLDAYLKRNAQMDGPPIPLQQLNGSPPSLGPVVFAGDLFNTTVYPGSVMTFKSTAVMGHHVNTTA